MRSIMYILLIWQYSWWVHYQLIWKSCTCQHPLSKFSKSKPGCHLFSTSFLSPTAPYQMHDGVGLTNIYQFYIPYHMLYCICRCWSLSFHHPTHSTLWGTPLLEKLHLQNTLSQIDSDDTNFCDPITFNCLSNLQLTDDAIKVLDFMKTIVITEFTVTQIHKYSFHSHHHNLRCIDNVLASASYSYHKHNIQHINVDTEHEDSVNITGYLCALHESLSNQHCGTPHLHLVLTWLWWGDTFPGSYPATFKIVGWIAREGFSVNY